MITKLEFLFRESCVFGTAWTDKYDGPLARNGCDTRNDVLKIQLVDVAFKPGTRDCKVIAGTLHDPYTGTDIAFSTSNPSAIQIDHVLSAALSRSLPLSAGHYVDVMPLIAVVAV
ncbi:HNH endonuclease family protein [Rhodococcus sp. 3-2]|uniref:HNH endonuclease family protein n=1 Tax=Rhodococcus sp. 3-2 TaxID=2890836 RepID=UPI001D187CF6|nr:HNH endonuclease family protein [Rhodococcus sp. 3-2]MCC4306665.1 HNH endonuclease family protein [Rhodococcus sp. 3-2]